MTLESQEEVSTYNLRSKNRYFENHFKESNGFRESIDDFLDIITTEKVEYYADKGETFNVVVHIYNPSSYEILSFTLNGYKYQALCSFYLKFDFSSQKIKFENAKKYTQTQKMIALSENGVIPHPNNLEKDNVHWLWFMTWNDANKSGTDKDNFW